MNTTATTATADTSGETPHPLPQQPGPRPAEPRECGWLASSLDLQRGVQVTEHADPRAVLETIPLGWWVDWESWRQGVHRR